MRTWKLMQTKSVADEGYCVFFEQAYEEDWGYMSMRDYPTYKATGKYRVTIAVYNSSGVARTTDHNAIDVRDLDVDFVNKLWYNLEHKTFTRRALLQALKQEGKKLIDRWGEEVYV